MLVVLAHVRGLGAHFQHISEEPGRASQHGAGVIAQLRKMSIRMQQGAETTCKGALDALCAVLKDWAGCRACC